MEWTLACASVQTFGHITNKYSSTLICDPPEGLWAYEDLNLGPHRYQRCALTV